MLIGKNGRGCGQACEWKSEFNKLIDSDENKIQKS